MAQADDALTLLVARLYDTAFNRYADADGAANWAAVLASGASLRNVSDRFFASAEFTARHAGQDDEAFVRSLYRDALEREPDAAGLANWVGRLAGGTSRSEVFFQFLECDEQKSGFSRSEIRGVEGFDPDDGASPTDRLVARLYDTAFNRVADASGAAFWASVVDSGASLREIAGYFFASEEFTARHSGQDDEAFVRSLYRDALEREPDAAGLANWVGRLAGGTSRSAVFFQFFDAEEQKRGFSRSITQGVSGVAAPPGNNPVDAADDAYAVAEDTSTFFAGPRSLLANDSAPDGGLSVVVGSAPGSTFTTITTANGQAYVNSDGSFTYTPNIGFRGTDRFTYRARDADGSTDDATVTINVGIGGGAPADAVDDTYTVLHDSTNRFTAANGVLANDTAPDGGLRVVGFVLGGTTLTTLATGTGIAQVSPDGSFTYQPAPGFTGVERLTYRVRDADGSTDDAIVTINVGTFGGNPFNAVDDAYTTGAGTLLEVFAPAGGGLLSNDSAPGNLIVVQAGEVVTAQGVRIKLYENGSFTYTPPLGFSGQDSFTYTATGPGGLSDTATVTITVLPSGFAKDDAYTTPAGTKLEFGPGQPGGLLANDDVGPGGAGLIAVDAGDVVSASGVRVALRADGGFTYVPTLGFSGVDRFDYVARRADGSADIGTASITVLPDGFAKDDAYSTPAGTLLTVFAPAGGGLLSNDVSGNFLIAVVEGTVASAAGGQARLYLDGTFAYTPPAGFTGNDTFTYTATRSDGSADTATVTVTVRPPDNPVTAADDAYTTRQGVALTVAAAGLLANDLAPDGGKAAVAGTFATTQGGSVTVAADGGFTYTPAAGFTGADSFDYTARDADGSTDTATATITVTAPSPPPPTPIPPVQLSDVALGIGGRRIRGEEQFDRAGTSVAGVGDLDGDGRDDVLIGAPYTQFYIGAPTPQLVGGSAYLLFSGAGITNLRVFSQPGGTTGGFRINGEGSADQAGQSVAKAGDVNGDGRPDLLIGAPLNDANTATPFFDGAGAAYVVFGKAAAGDVNLADVAGGSGGFKIVGEGAGDQAGYSVAGAGDVNGDGLADVVVGARLHAVGGSGAVGAAYVVFGKAGTAAVNLTAVAAGIGGFAINGEGAGGQAGSTVSSVGDMNGDGLADLLVGTSGNDSAGGGRSAYVVFGKVGTAAVNLTDVAAGIGGFKIARAGGLPVNVAGAGDVNGDGRPDLVIGVDPNRLVSTEVAAVATVVFGKADAAAVDIGVGSAFAGFRIVGTDVLGSLGAAVSAAGDLNGDGLGDLLIGAPGPYGDAAYAVFGKAGGADVNLADIAAGIGGFKVLPERGADVLGVSVSAAGDANGDGLDDLLVGSWATVDSLAQVGATYLIYGSPNW